MINGPLEKIILLIGLLTIGFAIGCGICALISIFKDLIKAILRTHEFHKRIRKIDNKRLTEYPADYFIHNSLRFIHDNNMNAAYEEVCFAILKSGGELSDEEEKYLNKIRKERDKDE